MTFDEIKQRVIGLGISYGLGVTNSDFSKTLLREVVMWRVHLIVGQAAPIVASLQVVQGQPTMIYGFGAEAYPDGFSFEDFSVVVSRMAEAAGYSRKPLELVK